MKVLSIKQPWAYLIATGIKDIENRSWKTNYRGKFLIHAPRFITKLDFYDLFTIDQLNVFSNSIDNNGRCIAVNCALKRYALSSIIGEVEIIDCVQDSKSIWADPKCWHWILKNAVLYDKPIINVKGKLSFWEYQNE